MDLRLVHLSFFGPWSLTMKQGMLLGLLGVSSSVGLASTVVNGRTIGNTVGIVTEPISSFFKSHISPQLKTIVQGASSIAKVLGGWSQSIYGKASNLSIAGYKPSDVLSGFQKIVESFKDWSSKLETFISSAWSSKDTILQYLSRDYIAQILLQISEFSELIWASFSLLMGTGFMALQHTLAPEGSSDNNSEGAKAAEQLQQAFSDNLFGIAKSAFYIVSKNTNKVKEISKDQLSQIIKFAFQNTDKFVSKVDALKDTNSEGAEGKWTNYHSSAQMINDIMGTTWSDMAYQFFNTIASGFTECSDNSSGCSQDKALPDLIDLLGKAFGLTKTSSDSKK